MKLTKAKLKRIIKEEIEGTMKEVGQERGEWNVSDLMSGVEGERKQQAAEQISAAVQNALEKKMSNDGIRDVVEDSLPPDNWRGNKNPLR